MCQFCIEDIQALKLERPTASQSRRIEIDKAIARLTEQYIHWATSKDVSLDKQ